MGKGIVATRCVPDASALIEQLTNLQFGEPSYYLLQRADDITDWKERTLEIVEIEAYRRGRLFGKDAEVRWKETIDGYSLLWLSEGVLPERFTALGEWEASAPRDVFLLGGSNSERKPWQSTRIPRELNYPIVKCQYPSVKVIQYRECNSQTIRFTRYTEFVGKQGD